jgi:hypothetical protein
MHLTEESPLATAENAAKLFEEWAPYWDLSRPVLLEKSPPNLIKTRFLQALYPGSSFVVIVRHPIPVSIPTAKWRGTRRYDRLLAHWFHCHDLFLEDEPHLERVHTIRYEQLVREPEPVLRGVFEFLGLDPIAPSEPVEAGANERYFARWQELKRDPRLRLLLDLTALRYDRVRSRPPERLPGFLPRDGERVEAVAERPAIRDGVHEAGRVRGSHRTGDPADQVDRHPRVAGAVPDHGDVRGEVGANRAGAVQVVVGEVGHRQEDVVEAGDRPVGKAAPVVRVPEHPDR